MNDHYPVRREGNKLITDVKLDDRFKFRMATYKQYAGCIITTVSTFRYDQGWENFNVYRDFKATLAIAHHKRVTMPMIEKRHTEQLLHFDDYLNRAMEHYARTLPKPVDVVTQAPIPVNTLATPVSQVSV